MLHLGAEKGKAMETKKVNGIRINRIMSTYGITVAIINFMGFMMANSGGIPVSATRDYEVWSRFMDENAALGILLSVLAFAVPTAMIILYRVTAKDQWAKRIINLPFVFSAIGSMGWVLSFCLQFIYFLIAKAQYQMHISELALVSFLNILQECICIFTLSFLTLDFIHRKFVLPKLFPEGQLGRYAVKMKPSVRFLVYVFYLSVCVFPVFFLTSSLITVAKNNQVQIAPVFFVVLVFVILISVIILWTFCDYVSAPLKKLKIGTQKIIAGEYGHHVDIVSHDDFGDLADAFNEMSNSLDAKNKKILAIQDSIIKGMAVMVESRDNSTGGHINRTSDCVKIFVEKLVQTKEYADVSPEYLKAIIKAAPMHDLGKIAVDDAVLRKPGKFTDEEYAIMKTHSAEGARIVEHVLSQVDDEQFKQVAINVAHYHHEKWDGSGYPDRIKGTEIPFEARVMALADVFDALVSKRCYKDSFSYDKAFTIIEESLGSHFDPELGRIFIACRSELQNLYDSY